MDETVREFMKGVAEEGWSKTLKAATGASLLSDAGVNVTVSRVMCRVVRVWSEGPNRVLSCSIHSRVP